MAPRSRVKDRSRVAWSRPLRSPSVKPIWLTKANASTVNGGRKLTPLRRLKIDPLVWSFGLQSSVVVAAGTRPRSRSLSR